MHEKGLQLPNVRLFSRFNSPFSSTSSTSPVLIDKALIDMDHQMLPPAKPGRARIDSMLSNAYHSRPTFSVLHEPQARNPSLIEMLTARGQLLGHLQRSYGQSRSETVEEAQFRLHNELTLQGLERYRDPIGQLVKDDDGMPLYRDARGNLVQVSKNPLVAD